MNRFFMDGELNPGCQVASFKGNVKFIIKIEKSKEREKYLFAK